jgi:hypothetical protein
MGIVPRLRYDQYQSEMGLVLFVPSPPAWFVQKSARLTAESLPDTGCVLVITNHDAYDYPWIAEQANLIMDTRNAL